MYCKNCGSEAADSMLFCAVCGARLEENQPERETFSVATTCAELDFVERPVEYRDEYRDEIYRKPAEERKLRASLIIVSILLVLVIGVGVVFGVMFFNNSKDGSTGSGKPSVTVNSYPMQTDKATLVLSGSVKTKNDATITINGSVIDTVSASEGTKQWSKEITLSRGSNTITIAISDNKGNSDSEQITITYNSTLLFEAGTILIKGDPAAVYVRPSPQKGEKFVLLIPQNDYTSQFVCVGEESKDSEGYIWCKVRTPANGLGWIRSDLVKPLQ